MSCCALFVSFCNITVCPEVMWSTGTGLVQYQMLDNNLWTTPTQTWPRLVLGLDQEGTNICVGNGARKKNEVVLRNVVGFFSWQLERYYSWAQAVLSVDHDAPMPHCLQLSLWSLA